MHKSAGIDSENFKVWEKFLIFDGMKHYKAPFHNKQNEKLISTGCFSCLKEAQAHYEWS